MSRTFPASDGARQSATATPWRSLDYPRQVYDFALAIGTALGVPDLAELGRGATIPLRTRASDQQTIWHKRYYNSFRDWRALYDGFIRKEIARYYSEPFYVQQIPTLRIHLPGNLAVGEFHTDRDYGHPDHELSFWVPLTAAFESNSVWIESHPGSGDYQPVHAAPGQVAVFDAVNLRHGNRINTTGVSRVSFDFRCVPLRRYAPNGRRSINAGLPFVPGAYYAPQPVEPLP
jgi:hypothetical protein